MPLREINLVTGNKNKLAEVQAILGATLSVTSQALDLTEIQGTIEEISKDKCRRAAEIVRQPFTSSICDTTDCKHLAGPWTGVDRRYMSLLQCT